jgi:hypothetical protein
MKRFDRILWRINGVLLLLAAASGVVLLIFGLVSAMFFDSSNERKDADAAIVNIDKSTRQKEYLFLGDSSEIKGLSIVRLPLYSGTAYRSYSSYGSSGGGLVRNYLFINYSNVSSRWLFDGFKRLILNAYDCHASLNNNKTNIVGSFYVVAASDTDGDGRVTENDRAAVFFSTPDGNEVAEVIPPTNRILSIEQVTDTEALIIYQKEQSTIALLLSTSTGKQVREAKLPMKQDS